MIRLVLGDCVAPEAVRGLQASAASSGVVNLAWTASTDIGIGGVRYRIYRNGAVLTTVATASHSDTTASASTFYTYQIEAYDAAGNNAARVSITVTTPAAVTYLAAGTIRLQDTWTALTAASHRATRGGVFPPGTPGGSGTLPTYSGFTLQYELDTTQNGNWWTWKTGKEHISAGYCGAVGTEHVAFDPANGVQIQMRKRSTPITAGGYSLSYNTAEGYLDGVAAARLPNYFRIRGVWQMAFLPPYTQFHVGLFPAFGWLRPYGGGDGEIDFWESFGGHITPSAPGSESGLINKTTLISTPYDSTQQNYVLKQDPTKLPPPNNTDLTVLLQDRVYELEKTPNRLRMWVDGVLMTEHTRGGSGGGANPGSGTISLANWDRCFEQVNQKWYYRFTGQIGNDPDGSPPPGGAGNVPADFVGADMRLKELAFWSWNG